MASWFSELNKLVDGLTEQMVAQASAATEEMELERTRIREEEDRRKQRLNKEVLLPWETDDESKAILSQSLMEEILSLSLVEQNFIIPPPHLAELPFHFESFVPVVMRLLKLDANLARMHAKLSPRMNEEVFWQHYYYRISLLRTRAGIEDDESIVTLLKHVPGDVVFAPTYVPPPAAADPVPGSTTKKSKEQKNKKKSDKTDGGDVDVDINDLDIDDDDDEEDEYLTVDKNGESPATRREQRRIADAQLAAEVEAELDNALDLDGVDDIDVDVDDFENLGELDELDDLDGIEDEDEDLEEQIARELTKEKA